MKERMRNILLFTILALIIIPLMIILYKYTPEEIVNYVGINNSLLFLFFVSLFAGFSAWTSFSLAPLLVTAVLGGLNPITLGILTGIGLIIGDFLMFYFGSTGMTLIPDKWEKRIAKFSKYFKEGKMRTAVPFITFIYMGLLPLPNDVLIIFLAMIKYPIKKLYIPIILGDLTFPLAITLLTYLGITIF